MNLFTRLTQRANAKGLLALLSISLLLSFTLTAPLNASKRMVLAEEITNVY